MPQTSPANRSQTPAVASPARLKRQWRAAEHEQRRALVIDVALELLQRYGPGEVTMRRVAARLGIGAMTLYTYVSGQEELRREMIRRGFDILHGGCQEASTLECDSSWRGGSRHYLQFAIDHPRLYELMFSTPIPPTDIDLLHGGFQPLLEKVRQRLADNGIQGESLDREARRRAGRFWISIHGLASLAIANRLCVLEGDVDQLLDDLLEHVSPD